MAKGKKYAKWYAKHFKEIEAKKQRAKEEPMQEVVAKKEKHGGSSLTHPVHGYFIYECESCGVMYRMYLDKGLEDRLQDRDFPDQHKPVPFLIGCRNCGKGYCKHILWGIGDSEVYEELPEGASYFKNDPNEECGVAVVNEPYAKSREDYYMREIIGRHSGRFA